MNKKGKNIEQKPFQPIVSLEQLLAFDPENPESFTNNLFVDSVMEAFFKIRPATRETLGHYLNIPPVKLAHTLEVLSGHTFAKIHEAWLHNQYGKLREMYPNWSTDKIGREMGFSDGSAVWRLLHRDVRKKRYKEWERKDKSQFKF